VFFVCVIVVLSWRFVEDLVSVYGDDILRCIMTLTTHTIVGTAVGVALLPFSPSLALLAAFASHFALDTIPHWDYKVPAIGEGIHFRETRGRFMIRRELLLDFVKVGIDIVLGIAIATIALAFTGQPLFPAVLVGAVGGILPDALQVVYGMFPHEPLSSLQRFHGWIQKGRHVSKPLIGLSTQIVCIVIALSFLMK
jgi:hypothetical protein